MCFRLSCIIHSFVQLWIIDPRNESSGSMGKESFAAQHVAHSMALPGQRLLQAGIDSHLRAVMNWGIYPPAQGKGLKQTPTSMAKVFLTLQGATLAWPCSFIVEMREKMDNYLDHSGNNEQSHFDLLTTGRNQGQSTYISPYYPIFSPEWSESVFEHSASLPSALS